MSKVARYVSTLWTRITDPATKDSSRDLAQKIEDLARQLEAMSGAMASGSIIHFDGATCPPGWSEYTAAENRMLRGMPSGGTPGATGGSDSHSHGMSHTHNISHTHTGSTNSAGDHVHTGLDASSLGTNFASGGPYQAANASTWTVSDGAHSHGTLFIDPPSTNTSGGASTSNTGSASTLPAYIQFLVCRKN